MSNYLIIYEVIPESTKVYYVIGVSEEDAKKLDACHNKMINSEEWPESEWLESWLETKDTLSLPARLYMQFTNIIITGFIM